MPIHIHDQYRSTPLVCWAAYQPRSWFKADTGAPALIYFFEALSDEPPSTWGSSDSWAEVGLGSVGMHAVTSLWRHQYVQMVPPQGPYTEFPSVPSPRPGRLPGEPNSPQEPNCQRAPSSLAHLIKGVIRTHRSCKTPSVPSTPTASPQPSHCPAKSTLPSGPLHSLLLPPCSTFPNFRRMDHITQASPKSLSKCRILRDVFSAFYTPLPSPSLLSFLSCHLSLSVAMVCWYYSHVLSLGLPWQITTNLVA